MSGSGTAKQSLLNVLYQGWGTVRTRAVGGAMSLVMSAERLAGTDRLAESFSLSSLFLLGHHFRGELASLFFTHSTNMY